MKVKFTELPVGSCFIHGRGGGALGHGGGGMKKKVGEAKASSVKANGRVSTRKVKGDPEVEPSPCPLRLLGVGLRRHPEGVVEIGDGDLLGGKKARRTR